jgi:cytochrome c553
MSGASDVPAMGTIDGLCSPCHDPHGVSPALGDKQAYALPMLKGTWLSSPYKEDGPPMTNDGYSGTNSFYNYGNYWLSGFVRPYPQKADPRPAGSWRSDRNTFNMVDLSLQANQPAPYNRVSEEAETFAGLCLRCHPKETLTSEAGATPTATIPWATPERIHRAVKGWGWSEGETPREHSYTCSKCHQPHASGLPRLMQTNCLNYPHRGKQLSGGSPVASGFSYPNRYGRFPNGWWDNGYFDLNSTAICHGAPTANGSANWPDNQGWNTVTPWTGGQ